MIPVLRRSFGARLLAALLLSVAVVLAVALLVVRRETTLQVERVTARVTHQSREAYRELEELQQLELARLGRAFAESPRAGALLEEALESAELDYLMQEVQYELYLRRLPRHLALFTDAEARPLLALVHDQPRGGDATADIEQLAGSLLRDSGDRLDGYGVVDDELFVVHIRRLEWSGRVIGAVAFGLPVGDSAVQRLGDVLGAELCFVVDGRCLAGTRTARAELGEAMTSLAPSNTPAAVSIGGRRWVLRSEPLFAGHQADGTRTLAISLDEVLSPFERIERTLIVAGLIALALSVGLGALLSRALGRPVRELVLASGRVADGDYSTRVRVRSADELGMLAGAFNDMAAGLELKDRYRGVLDKVVSRDVAEELLRSEVMLGGETREVTILFADICSFTSLTEGMEPQRVIRLLNDCMARLGDVIESSDAVVDKFLGDGLMALFGAPVRQDDDAANAVHAALRMQEEMTELNRELASRGEVAVDIAIGIDGGTVVAGNMGSPSRLNYTVVGEAVNLAARLCQAAGPGEILVSGAVHARVHDRFELHALGARHFKGFSRAIDVYAVDRPSLLCVE